MNEVGKSITVVTSPQEEVKPSKFSFKNVNVSSIVLLSALFVHAFIEGLALGLTHDERAVLNLMLAMIIHKICAAISLGISMSKDSKTTFATQLVMITFFSLATPVAIAIGLTIQGSNNTAQIVFNSFAAGTFIYISASDVVVQEFEAKQRSKGLQLAAFVTGSAIITLLWLIESPHSH